MIAGAQEPESPREVSVDDVDLAVYDLLLEGVSV
jgi:hypothetical protein